MAGQNVAARDADYAALQAEYISEHAAHIEKASVVATLVGAVRRLRSELEGNIALPPGPVNRNWVLNRLPSLADLSAAAKAFRAAEFGSDDWAAVELWRLQPDQVEVRSDTSSPVWRSLAENRWLPETMVAMRDTLAKWQRDGLARRIAPPSVSTPEEKS